VGWVWGVWWGGAVVGSVVVWGVLGWFLVWSWLGIHLVVGGAVGLCSWVFLGAGRATGWVLLGVGWGLVVALLGCCCSDGSGVVFHPWLAESPCSCAGGVLFVLLWLFVLWVSLAVCVLLVRFSGFVSVGWHSTALGVCWAWVDAGGALVIVTGWGSFGVSCFVSLLGCLGLGWWGGVPACCFVSGWAVWVGFWCWVCVLCVLDPLGLRGKSTVPCCAGLR